MINFQSLTTSKSDVCNFQIILYKEKKTLPSYSPLLLDGIKRTGFWELEQNLAPLDKSYILRQAEPPEIQNLHTNTIEIDSLLFGLFLFCVCFAEPIS